MATDAVRGDRRLVRRLLDGEQRAFEQFADDYLPRLYRFVGSRLAGDRELTAEVVQSAVCKAIGKLESWRGEATLFTWLCACCRSEIALYFRSKSRRPQLVELSEAVLPPDLGAPRAASPEESAIDTESQKLVHQILDSLPSRYGQILEWKYFEERPVQEIANLLGSSPKATESLLTRARNAFRDAYQEREGEGGGPPLAFPGLPSQPVTSP